MDLGLTDKIIIVTGGAKGIGAAAVRSFAAEGAKVVITGRSPAEGIALAQETNGLFIEAELSDESACRRVVEETLAAYDRIDVLVNNAGYNDGKNLESTPKGLPPQGSASTNSATRARGAHIMPVRFGKSSLFCGLLFAQFLGYKTVAKAV